MVGKLPVSAYYEQCSTFLKAINVVEDFLRVAREYCTCTIKLTDLAGILIVREEHRIFMNEVREKEQLLLQNVKNGNALVDMGYPYLIDIGTCLNLQKSEWKKLETLYEKRTKIIEALILEELKRTYPERARYITAPDLPTTSNHTGVTTSNAQLYHISSTDETAIGSRSDPTPLVTVELSSTAEFYKALLRSRLTRHTFHLSVLEAERVVARDCPLHLAILDNNFVQVEILCRNSDEMKKKDLWGRTALHMAVIFGMKMCERLTITTHSDALKILIYLLHCGMSPFDVDDLLRWNAFEYAAAVDAIPALDLMHHATELATRELQNNSRLNDILRIIDVTQNMELGVTEEEQQTVLDLMYKNDCHSTLGYLINNFPAAECCLLTVKHQNTALHVAAKAGSYRIMSLLLSRGLQLEASNQVGQTALHLAATYNHVKCVEILLKNGANVFAKDENEDMPLNLTSSVNVMELLLSAGANCNGRNIKGWSPLHSAVRNNEYDGVVYLIGKGANVNLVSNNKVSCLHIAAQFGHEKILNHLATLAADINICNINGKTPLHMAVEYNRYECVKYLTSHGADVNLTTQEGVGILHVASQLGYDKILEFLVTETGTDIDLVAKFGQTALHITCKRNNIRCAEILLQNGAHVNYKDENGNSPLHFSSRNGNLEITEQLITRAAEVNVVNKSLETPLHLATENGSTSCIRTLIENGAAVNCKDVDGSAPMHLAAKDGRAEIIKLLLHNGADVNVVNKKWRTPLHIASETGDINVVRLLVQNSANVNACTCMFFENKFIGPNKQHVTPISLANKPDILEYLKRNGAKAKCNL